MNRWDITDVKNLEFDDNVSKKVVEIRCVDTADLPQPQADWCVGSIAFVINTGKFYALTPSGWTQVPMDNVSEGSQVI